LKLTTIEVLKETETLLAMMRDEFAASGTDPLFSKVTFTKVRFSMVTLKSLAEIFHRRLTRVPGTIG
jgi:hypothetical protein